MTCSVGLAFDDGGTIHLADMLRRADAAMYRHTSARGDGARPAVETAP